MSHIIESNLTNVLHNSLVNEFPELKQVLDDLSLDSSAVQVFYTLIKGERPTLPTCGYFADFYSKEMHITKIQFIQASFILNKAVYSYCTYSYRFECDGTESLVSLEECLTEANIVGTGTREFNIDDLSSYSSLEEQYKQNRTWFERHNIKLLYYLI